MLVCDGPDPDPAQGFSMDKAKFGLSKNKGIHILSSALVAAELSILVPVKEIEDQEG